MTIFETIHSRLDQSPPTLWHQNEGDDWHSQSWQDFQERIATTALALLFAKIGKGDRVLIALESRAEWDWLEFACYQIGAVVVGVDHYTPAEIVAKMAALAEPRLAFFESAKSVSPELVATIEAKGGKVVFLHAESSQQSWQSFFEKPMRANDSTMPSVVSPTDAATLIFTSGTSGEPKGIVYSHEQVCTAIDALMTTIDLPRLQQLRTVSWLSRASIFQRMFNFCAMTRGADIYYLRDPRKIDVLLKNVQPQILVGVPRFYEKIYGGFFEALKNLPGPLQRLIKHLLTAQSNYLGLSSLVGRFAGALLCRKLGVRFRFLISGSSPLSPEVLRFFWRIEMPLLEAYGLSENIVPLSMNTLQEYRFGSVGKPLPTNQVKIAADQEVLVRGSGVFKGYYRSSAGRDQDFASTELFDSEGFYKTGDLGRFDQDGFLYLFGRKRSLLKTSTGKKIYAKPIELKLLAATLAENALVVAEGKPYPIALLFVGSNSSQGSEHYKSALLEINRILDKHERLRKVIVLKRSLSVAKQELTMNLKPRDAEILRIYSDLANKCYEEKNLDLNQDGFLIELE